MTRKQYMSRTAIFGLVMLSLVLAVDLQPFSMICYYIGVIMGIWSAPEK